MSNSVSYPKIDSNIKKLLPQTILLDPLILANVKQVIKDDNNNNNDSILQGSMNCCLKQMCLIQRNQPL